MAGFEAAKWKMKNLLPGPWSPPNPEVTVSTKVDAAVVRLIDSPHRLPATRLEERLISALKEAGSISFASLVKTVAADLYAEELHKGAGILDIGLFGSRLFNGDVIRELQAGDGTLWEIKQEREIG